MSVSRVLDLRNDIPPELPLYRVPGLRDTIALKRLCVVSLIYVTIYPLKRLCTLYQAYVTQLPKNLCAVWKDFLTKFLLKRLFAMCQVCLTQLP